MKTRLEEVQELLHQSKANLNDLVTKIKNSPAPCLEDAWHKYDAELENYVKLRIEKSRLQG